MPTCSVSKDSSPNSLDPITANLNSILLHVSVPVLSLNMYSICPNYSFRDEEKTVTPFYFTELYNNLSCIMKTPWIVFTISMDTIKEMGIIVLRSTK